ncbi:SusC/RagA family TonB-linked outer membrane protein [Gaoshiqia sediminis]|uniref:SusC/RagA family TonB-linked outer membrane protein n=1 Tax=Gaoshiqia sediminis TaxID=2986998 RepID=A0AA41YCR8_9BACT|nr:SusC/RagA family TonB-linked outer membrane protein [Gaoshiqia sediminis]MCW0482727.1 SusC/RagA family TonB-linked outer membrane protein [Gaoshiqia sediminis]
MKKINVSYCHNRQWRKLLLIMKFAWIFILAGFFAANAETSYSQNTRLDLKLENASLKSILHEIEEISDYYFFYKSDEIENLNGISIDAKQESIQTVLDKLLAENGFIYEIHDRYIMIKKGGESSTEADLSQQQQDVSGKVSDSSGIPLPGVTVVLKGTTHGTITDANGTYVLANVPGNGVLVFSFVGMKAQDVPVTGKTTINVILEEETIGLEEVVAIGYGTQSKRFVTGSISSIDMEEFKTLSPVTNVSQAIGEVAGVQFLNNGRPGQGGSILIRGQNSLGTSSSPLIVLDGIIFEGSISDIDPQDIKTLDVLKDAASCAIYGSKAANGVIMITSNKGSSSKPEIRINTTYGISEASRWLPMPSKEEYIQRKRDYYTQQLEIAGNDLGVDVNDMTQVLDPEEYENYSNGKFTSFKDLVGRQGQLSTLDLSVSGRTDNTSYLFSGSLSNDVGLILGDKQEKVSFRINLETKIAGWLTVGTMSFFTYRDLSGIVPDLSDAYDDSPLGNFYYPDGNVKFNPISADASTYNALYNYELTDNKEIGKNLFSNMYANIDFPFLKGLSAKINYSPNMEWHNEYSFRRQDPYSAGNTTNAVKNNRNITRWVWESILNYKKDLGENHNIDVTLMYGRNKYSQEETNVEAGLFEIGILGYNNFGLGSNYEINTPAVERFGVSSLARVNYTLMNRYMLSVAARRDGSSVFGENHKFGVFPSWAMSWIASEESFFKNIELINFLKFRLSYGESGNSDIPPYQTQSLNRNIYNVVGNNTGSPIAFIPDISVMGNENIRWEATKSFNLGLDFSIWENKLSGSIDLYKKTTTDQLVKRNIPPTNGYESTYDNIGEVSNKGIELTLNTKNVDTPEFSWQTSFSFAYNKNKIVHLFGDIDGDGIEDDALDNNWFIGENINSYFDYKFDGIYQESENSANPLYFAGDIKLKDVSGNGSVNIEDRTIVGNGKFPDFTLNLSNTFRYKNLSFYISMNSMLGWVAPFDLVYSHGVNRAMNSLMVDYWTPENKSNELPSLLYSNAAHNNHYYISRDFLRIKNVSLSYDINKLNMPVINKFKSLRVTLNVNNLYTFTKWLGPDPENAQDITSNKGSDDLYPMPRTYSIGLNMSF